VAPFPTPSTLCPSTTLPGRRVHTFACTCACACVFIFICMRRCMCMCLHVYAYFCAGTCTRVRVGSTCAGAVWVWGFTLPRSRATAVPLEEPFFDMYCFHAAWPSLWHAISRSSCLVTLSAWRDRCLSL
jgi:hypothetical protein